MANYNRVILAGNLTRDPQLSCLPNNTPVVDFGMAINRRWRGQDGEQREETCFVDCTAFGRQAEVLNEYMSKGRPILIEGRLHYSQWEKDGQKRSRLRVRVDNFQFLDSRGQGAPQAPAQARPAAAAQPPAAQPPAAPQAPDETPQAPAAAQPPAAPQAPDETPQAPAAEPPSSEFDDGGDDIPF